MFRRGGSNRGRGSWNQNRNSGGGGGDGGGGSGSNWVDEHDDRDRAPKNKNRRVSFKPSGSGGGGRGGGSGGGMKKIVSRMEDFVKNYDEEMVDFAGNKSGGGTYRRGPKNSIPNRRKGSPPPRLQPRRLLVSPAGWYLVSIPYGQKYNKDVIIRTLLGAISPDVFIPHYWRQEKDCVIFYLDECRIAEKLMLLSREIQMPDGFKLIIRVRGGVPTVHIDSNVRERMKLTMAKRYNAANKALDLTKFHADPDLRDIFCALFRPTIMTAVIDIMAANIPELEALNLNDNKIHLLDHFKCMGDKLPNLRILYLARNRIESSVALNSLKTIPLVELVLEGNPVINSYKSDELYKSDMRRKFPKLRKLDGVELEPLIGFDVDDVKLPTAKASFLYDAAGADIVRQFIEQYFIIFDSGNRQPLLDAYHESAMVSLSVGKNSYPGPGGAPVFSEDGVELEPLIGFDVDDVKLPPAKASFLCDAAGADIVRQFIEQYFIIFDSGNRQPLLDAYHESAMISLSVGINSYPAPKLNMYYEWNHNLLRMTGDKSRNVRYGRLPAVSLLSELPGTQHDAQSFSVDLTLFTPKLINFVVTGIFREIPKGSTATSPGPKIIRSFQRVFMIVPAGSGFCIRNEMIYISNTTQAQLSRAFKPRPQEQVQQPTTPNMPAVPATILDENTKIQMIQAMSALSNMNLEWTKKCLDETNWDYNHAINVFTELHKQGKIPPEAFMK